MKGLNPQILRAAQNSGEIISYSPATNIAAAGFRILLFPGEHLGFGGEGAGLTGGNLLTKVIKGESGEVTPSAPTSEPNFPVFQGTALSNSTNLSMALQTNGVCNRVLVAFPNLFIVFHHTLSGYLTLETGLSLL